MEPWWIWAVSGLLLLAFELLTPGGFFLCFFGAGALIVAALDYLNLVSSGAVQWLAFTVISLVLLFTLRRKLQSLTAPPDSRADRDDMVNQIGSANQDIAVGEIGQVDLRGTVWNSRNVGASAISTGERVRVVRVDGLTLEILAE